MIFHWVIQWNQIFPVTSRLVEIKNYALLEHLARYHFQIPHNFIFMSHLKSKRTGGYLPPHRQFPPGTYSTGHCAVTKYVSYYSHFKEEKVKSKGDKMSSKSALILDPLIWEISTGFLWARDRRPTDILDGNWREEESIKHLLAERPKRQPSQRDELW